MLHRIVLGAALVGLAAAQTCQIQALFGQLTAITESADCRAGCNDGAGEDSCGEHWYPGSNDNCNVECGREYEPFWDQCSEMLLGMHMGGMDEMSVFYERCAEVLYPPGECGVLCTEHTFDCFLEEVQNACCDEDGTNCVSSSDVPERCPIGCAVVFPDFMHVCGEYVNETMAHQYNDFENFAQLCVQADGEDIIEYMIDLRRKGCEIDLSAEMLGRRRTQFMSTWLGSTQETCPWDEMEHKARDVDEVCCGQEGENCIASINNQDCDPSENDCTDGLVCEHRGPGEHECLFPSFSMPPNCTAGCAIVLREFNHTCGEAFHSLLGGGDIVDAIYSEVGAKEDGWSNTEVTEAMPDRAGTAGKVHGPFGNDVTEVSMTVSVPYDAVRCEITWTSWGIDSRDGETDRLLVNGDVVWEKAAHQSCEGWEHGPSDFVQHWNNDEDICMVMESVEVQCPGEELTLQFTSEIDQPEEDEAWAFSDVHVHPYGRQDRLETVMQFDSQCMEAAEDNMDLLFDALDNAQCPDDLDAGAGTGGASCYEVRCGRGDNECTEQPRCSHPLEENEVACCADSAVQGFRHVCDDRPVWGERDTQGMRCNHHASHAEAAEFCRAMGGRLCTADEINAGCTRGTGCSHDADLVWTSTPGTGGT